MFYGDGAKYYNYVTSLFMSVSSFYNYSFVKVEDIEEYIKKNGITEKICFYDNENIGLVINNNTGVLGFSDAISLMYRLLEETGLNITVNIENDKELINYLDILDIDYEINDKDFEIVDDRGNILAISNKCNGYVSIKANIKTIVDALMEENKDNKLANAIDVYIVANSLEERMKASSLAQDLRWNELKVDIDYLSKTKEEQLDIANNMRARIIVILNDEDLKKGIIIIKDNLTNDEIKIDESEIIDYIISNL